MPVASPDPVTAERRDAREPLDLDLVGLKCPLPVLRTRKALRRLGPGARLQVRCTDPLCGLDIPNLVREEGDALEAQGRDGGVFRFVIRRVARPASDPAP